MEENVGKKIEGTIDDLFGNGEEPEPSAQGQPPASTLPQASQQTPSPGPQYTAAEVRETQRLLTELGYSPGPVDGIYGSKTLRAILAFETDRGLKPTGKPSPEVIAHMRTAVAVAGAAGPEPHEQPHLVGTPSAAPPWSAAAAQGAPLPAAPTAEPSYPDLVRLALLADPAAYAAQREVAGVAYRLAVADEPACRQLSQRIAGMTGDAFAARDFVLESAGLLDEALANLDTAPRALEVLLSDRVYVQTYDFAAGGYPLAAVPLVRGGERRLTDRISAPPCDIGLPLHHALPEQALTISRVGLGTLSVELEGAPGASILPMAASDAQAFEARNAKRMVELVGHVRLEPPAAAFAPLRGRILALEARDPATGETLYRFPLAPEVAAAADPRAPGYQPEYADFVYLALMSDLEAYLAEAEAAGLAFILATADEEECREIDDIMRSGNEFARRDLAAEAGRRFREVAGTLDARPRRFEIAIEAKYRLDTYDFDREGFTFAEYQELEQPILAPGVVTLPGGERPNFCNVSVPNSTPLFGSMPKLAPLGAEHQGVPGVALLPMPPEQARAFRADGKSTVVLRAELVVEPRAQGRGPLAGRITALSAHDPETGELLHRFDLGHDGPPLESPDRPLAWTVHLAAGLLGPAIEPTLPGETFDHAATSYFNQHRRSIDQGNLPPEAPLPIEEMRGRQPQVIVALNRERLRAGLREPAVETPFSVVIEEDLYPHYREGVGITLNAFIGHDWLSRAGAMNADPLLSTTLSSRDLPIYERPSFLWPWKTGQELGFRTHVITRAHVRPALELDRILRVGPIPVGIEQAAARGLLGYGPDKDMVIARWQFEILGARMDDRTPVISARLISLSFRWASDDAPLGTVDVAALPTVAALRAPQIAAQAQAEAEEAERERRAAAAAQARLAAILQGRTGLVLIRRAEADRVTQVLVKDESVAEHYRTLVLVNGLDLPSQARVLGPLGPMTAHFLRSVPGAAVLVDSDVFAQELFDLVADLDLEAQALVPESPAPAEQPTEPPPSTAQAVTLEALAPGDAPLLLVRRRGDGPIERVFAQSGVHYSSQMREASPVMAHYVGIELDLDLPERAETIALDEAPEVLRLTSDAAVVLRRDGLEKILPQISDLDLVAIRFPIEEYRFGIPKDHTKGADAFAILGITGGMDKAAALEELNWTFAPEEIVREPAGDAIRVSRGACDPARATAPATAAEIGAYCLTLGLADGAVAHVRLRQVVEGDAAEAAVAALTERYGRSQRFREARHLERGGRRIVLGWGEALDAGRDQLGRVAAKSPPAVLEAVVWVVDDVTTVLLHLDDMTTVAEVEAAQAPEIKF